MPQLNPPPFLASNQFFYYADLARAAQFYSEVLGFRQLADYGMARIFQVARSSFVTLVEAGKGMHSAEERKTVTLALIVPDVEGWYQYLQSAEVPIHRPLSVQPGQAHDGFVALDPEGYFLEFERFNTHQENGELLFLLEGLPITYPDRNGLCSRHPAQVPEGRRKLGVLGTVLWLYYTNIQEAETFLHEGLELQQVVGQCGASVYHASPSGFLGTVVSGQGLHTFTQDKAVTISLWTSSTASMQQWFARMQDRPDFRLRSDEIVQRERYHAFVGYSPGNYYLEFNLFLEHADNRLLMQAIYP